MSQQPPFEVPGDGSAADIRGTLPAGRYIAQVAWVTDSNIVGVRYATAEEAPADDDAYFSIRTDLNEAFTFYAGPGTLPTWVAAVPGGGLDPETRLIGHVAIARVTG